MPEDFKFVLGKEIGPGRIGTVRGCDTEEELRELYRNLLIQSGFGSGYFPYQRIKEGSLVRLWALAFEVEEKFREERERNADISSYVM